MISDLESAGSSDASAIEPSKKYRKNTCFIQLGVNKLSIQEWSAISGVSVSTIKRRLYRGWCACEAVWQQVPVIPIDDGDYTLEDAVAEGWFYGVYEETDGSGI